MRLRSFHGSTLTEAMRLVRDSLGDNAIIVATRDDDMGGVRVTAAIDEQPLQRQTEPTEVQAPSSLPDSTGSDVIEIIATTLLKHQVPTALAERLLASATQFANDDPVLCLGAALDTHLTFAPLPDDKTTKPLIFIGAPGVGKTLTIAKLATKATLAKRQVAVISTDVERAGGMEQLEAFTRLLKIKLIEIEDQHALKDAVDMIPKGTLILIDTPGRNPFDTAERQQVQALVTASGAEAVLVLPADTDPLEAIDQAQAFKTTGATRLFFTRLDMTKRMGCILRTAYETKLPLCNYSQSHKVTEAPQVFNPISLARLILPSAEATDKAKATDTHTR